MHLFLFNIRFDVINSILASSGDRFLSDKHSLDVIHKKVPNSLNISFLQLNLRQLKPSD